LKSCAFACLAFHKEFVCGAIEGKKEEKVDGDGDGYGGGGGSWSWSCLESSTQWVVERIVNAT